jgi:hypothetical protein
MYCLRLQGDRSGSGGCWSNLEEGKCPLYYFKSDSSHNEDGGSTFPQKVSYMLWKPPKSPSFEQCSKDLKTYIKSMSVTLCNVSSMEWLSGTKFMYCCLHSATDRILEDITSHHITLKLFCVAGFHLSNSFTVTIFCFVRNLYLHLCSAGITLIFVLLQ